MFYSYLFHREDCQDCRAANNGTDVQRPRLGGAHYVISETFYQKEPKPSNIKRARGNKFSSASSLSLTSKLYSQVFLYML